MATASMPTVSWTSAANATLSLVPTPSVPEISTGSRHRAGSSRKRPPNPPTSVTTPGVKVLRTEAFMSSTARLPSSMSTPELRYVRPAADGAGWQGLQ